MTAKQRQRQYRRILEVFGVAIEDAVSHRQQGKPLNWARLCLVVAVKQNHPSWSNLAVARYVGRRDASTVLYSIRRFEVLFKSSAEFRQIAESFGLEGSSKIMIETNV